MASQQYQITQKGQELAGMAQKAVGTTKFAAPIREDIQSAEPYGLPADWDYKTAELGPGGEKPYAGQQGWDAAGRRYYGGGIAGAIKGVWARLGAPIGETPGLEQTKKPLTITGGGGAIGLYSVRPGTTIQALDISGTVNALTARASNLGRAPGTEVGLNVQSIPTLIGRGASEVVRGIVGVLQQPSKAYKRYVGGVAAGLAEAGTASPLPVWAPNLTLLPEQFKKIETEIFPRIDPVGLAYNALRTVTSGRPLEEIANIVGQNIDAARMFYTSVMDPMAKQEFLRRFASGEDPNLLATELENPLYEAVGEAGFDPLNVLGAAVFRPARDARRIASVSDEFISFSDDGVRVALEGLGNVAGEGKAIEAIDELAKAQIISSTATRTGLDRFARDTSLYALTVDGKRFQVSRRAEELLGWIAHNSSGPEETLEIYRGLALANSGDSAKVALGIDILNNFKVPRPLYSRAANEAGILMNELIGDDPVKFLDELAEVTGRGRGSRAALQAEFEKLTRQLWDPTTAKAELPKLRGRIAEIDNLLRPATPEAVEAARVAEAAAARNVTADLVAHVDKKLSPIVDRMFPTIAERVAAGEEVSGTLKALSNFDGIVRSNVMRPVNSFFAAIYMGMSPGYALRNLVTNSFHIFVDEGPGAFRFGPKRWLDEAGEYLGGRLPKTFGFTPVAAADVRPSGKFFNFFMKQSEKFEQGASARVVGHSVSRTMRKMLQPGRAIPDVKPLIDAGMPQDAADLLMRVVTDNRGNLGKAEATFREAVKAGSVESFRNVSAWADPDDLARLHEFGLFDDVNDVLKLGDEEEAAAAWAERLEDFRAEAAKVQLEPSAIPDESAMKLDTAALGGAREAGYISDEVMAATQSRFVAADNAMGQYHSAVNELARQAYYAAGQQQVSAPMVERIAEGYKSLLNGEIEQLARTQRQKFWDSIWKWSDDIKSMPGETDWAAIWKRAGIDGQPPAGLTKKQLLNMLWDSHARPTVDRMVQATRDQIAIGSEAFAREMGAVAGFEPNTPLLQQARQSYLLSVRFDNSAILRDNRIYHFGVGGELFEVRAGEGIDNTRHLLNAINENLPEGLKPYEALHDVPPNVARRALQQRAQVRAAEALKNAKAMTVEELVARGIPPESAEAIIRSMGLADPAPGMIRIYRGAGPGIDPQGAFWSADRTFAESPAFGGARGGRLYYQDIPADVWEQAKLLAVEQRSKAGLGAGQSILAEGTDLEGVLPKEFAQNALPFTPSEVENLIPPMAPGAMPTHARAIQENLAGIEQLFSRIENGMRANWGTVEAIAPWGDEAETALRSWLKTADGRIAEARLMAEAVAQSARDFTLLAYPEKRNIDLALSYIYPYQFWYSRTYAHWLKRVVSNPEIIANYGRYRETLEKIHAGAPEWWKYNINSNELLGLDSDNPLFFNLEATLNPLNGLVGIDFDDPYKRTGWFTSLLQETGKLGPSTWAPYAIATALALYMRGENEAAEHWAGRLFPQTAAIRSATAMATGTPLELDPFVHFFSGGLGPFERRRAGRALAAMDNERLYPTADILDAAYNQRGPIWDAAVLREATERGPGQLASFFLGTGFKARTRSDLEIDSFYGDYHRFWAMEPNYSPDEVRQGMEALRKKYPFMDTLLLSRKGGLDRDRAFAYNVLGRIPPAQSDDFADLVGIPGELLSRFYEDKGHIEQWPETDRDRFMAGILDLSAVLDMPNEATRGEWNEVRSAYQSMLDEGERQFGEGIWSRVDAYFGAKGDSPAEREAAERILATDPAIGAALDWKAATILRSPTLSAYYNSIEKVEQYYRGLMYDAIEKELGKDIWEKWDVYYFLKDVSSSEARKYWASHPELKRYRELREAWLPIAEQKAIEIGLRLPEGKGATLREIEGEMGIGAEAVAQNFPTVSPGAITPEMWQDALGDRMFRLLLDYLLDDEPLTGAVRDKLEELALQMGIPGGADGMASAVGQSIPGIQREFAGVP